MSMSHLIYRFLLQLKFAQGAFRKQAQSTDRSMTVPAQQSCESQGSAQSTALYGELCQGFIIGWEREGEGSQPCMACMPSESTSSA